MPSGPKIPSVPSATSTANTQFQYGKDTQLRNIAANRLDTTTPFGGVQFDQAGTDAAGNPQYNQASNLSPDIQRIVDALEGTQGNLAEGMATNYTGLPDFSEAAGTQVNTNMQRYMNYSNPLREAATNRLDNQLRNQGLMPGTTAYNNAMRDLQDNQARESDIALAGYQNNAFQQAVSQYNNPAEMIGKLMQTTLSTDPSGRLAALRPGPESIAQPNFADIQSQTNQANMARYNAQLAQQQQMMTGLMQGGMMLAGVPTGGNFLNNLGRPFIPGTMGA